jgi:C4-dicarboxylate-specific signal transduction histidine kinase
MRSAVIDINDDGPGFQPELLQKAFSPFVSTKVNGTGLGLAIARRIITEHGGSISAMNLESGGAKLEIKLPLADGSA